MWGYYDKSLLNAYPKTLEWQYRDEYPFEDALGVPLQTDLSEWDSVSNTISNPINTHVKSPEEFKKEIEELKLKYKDIERPNMWENKH